MYKIFFISFFPSSDIWYFSIHLKCFTLVHPQHPNNWHKIDIGDHKLIWENSKNEHFWIKMSMVVDKVAMVVDRMVDMKVLQLK